MTPLKYLPFDYMLLSVSTTHVEVTELFLRECGASRKTDLKKYN